jgi:hypothetical protein
MIRLLQFSVLIVAMLVARHVLYRWTRQRDPLPALIGRGLSIVVGYMVYIMAGMVALSWLAGSGFGEGSGAAALVLILGAALYVGVGVGGLWLLLRRDDERRAAGKR